MKNWNHCSVCDDECYELTQRGVGTKQVWLCPQCLFESEEADKDDAETRKYEEARDKQFE